MGMSERSLFLPYPSIVTSLLNEDALRISELLLSGKVQYDCTVDIADLLEQPSEVLVLPEDEAVSFMRLLKPIIFRERQLRPAQTINIFSMVGEVAAKQRCKLANFWHPDQSQYIWAYPLTTEIAVGWLDVPPEHPDWETSQILNYLQRNDQPPAGVRLYQPQSNEVLFLGPENTHRSPMNNTGQPLTRCVLLVDFL